MIGKVVSNLVSSQQRAGCLTKRTLFFFVLLSYRLIYDEIERCCLFRFVIVNYVCMFYIHKES